jgi:hypothetical protein
MTIDFTISGKAVLRLIVKGAVPLILKWILFPLDAFAEVIASLREPEPESFVFVTVYVAPKVVAANIIIKSRAEIRLVIEVISWILKSMIS